MAGQKVTTYYNAPGYPGSQAHPQQPQTPAQIQARHAQRVKQNQQARRQQSGWRGAIRTMGMNFSANMHRPVFADESPRPRPRKGGRKSSPRRQPAMMSAPQSFLPGDFYWDLSSHPDPMYRGEPREPERRKKKSSKGSGNTEIHYHYHY